MTLARNVQASPPRSYDPDVEWAVAWLGEVNDVPLLLCFGTLPLDLQREVIFNPGAVFVLAAGAFVIEHPNLADNLEEVHLAAVTAVVDAYNGERKRGAPASPFLEEMAARARAGTLRAQVVERMRICKRNEPARH